LVPIGFVLGLLGMQWGPLLAALGLAVFVVAAWLSVRPQGGGL